jgi:hypothetical protein
LIKKQPVGIAVAVFLVAGLLLVAGHMIGSCYKKPDLQPVSGSDLITQYGLIADPTARHMFVIQQVAALNMPSSMLSFVTIKVTGQKGTEVEFEVSPHPLRIGTDKDWIEVPLDGPHSLAAAKLVGCTLPTLWMAKQTDLMVRKTRGMVHFFDALEITNMTTIDWDPKRPDGSLLRSPALFQRRNELLQAWLTENKFENQRLVGGYYKDIIQPDLSDGLLVKNRLWTYGGYDDQGDLIQPVSGMHLSNYFDYATLPRFVKLWLKVDDQKMTINDFTNNADYAIEFKFDPVTIPVPPYELSPELEEFVRKNRRSL